MRADRIFFVTLVCLLAIACVKPPPTTSPEIEVEPPDAWTARPTDADAPELEWWDDFGDSSLDSLIQTALEENIDLIAAAARVDRAVAQARIAGADLKPRIGIGASGSYQRFNPAIFGQEGAPPVTFNQYGLSLDVSWEVDLWGRLRAGARAALAEAQAVDADLAGARLSLAGQTAKTWFAVAEALQQVELASSSAESFRRSSDWIRQRYEMGIRPPLDLRLALSNQAAAEALLGVRREQLDRTLRQLEVLLARYPSARLLEMFPSTGLPELPAPPPVGLPAEIVSRRPDLVAAERRLASTDQSLLSARRALYPRLSLTGSGGTLALQIADLLDGDFGVWTLAANLTQPLFEGGRLRAGVDQAAAGRDEALARYVSSVLQAYREVESALAAEAFLKSRVAALEEAATQTIAAQRLSEDRYAQGVGGYLVVLESQSRALTSQSELLSARRAMLDNRVDLHLALGGGFDFPIPNADGDDPTDTAKADRAAEDSAL
jgi:NodT family efflux transporter outer membrane factor (OMF) lipoprotein